MIKWIFEHFGVVIVVVVFLSQMVRAVLQARKVNEKRDQSGSDVDAERRVREVQEQIRRRIAARRGESAPVAPPIQSPEPQARPPLPRAETTQMPEPFGGPLGRMFEELQRRAQPQLPPQTPPPVLAHRGHAAELERQQRIADELKAIQDAGVVAKRRAAHVAAAKETEAQMEPALRSAAHDRLLNDLRDPQSLRRAILLREVLGTPVGLR